MQEATPTMSATTDDDDARLASLGYKPQLNRVLGLFSNFSVAFTYLSPIVGVFSLFTLGAGMAGPAYVWTTWIPVAGMLLVALVFGELASHYPIAGALYQYSKYNVGRRYGWFVGCSCCSSSPRRRTTCTSCGSPTRPTPTCWSR